MNCSGTSEHFVHNTTDINKTVPLQAVKTWRGLHPFFTSIIIGGEQSASRPDHFIIEEGDSITHQKNSGWAQLPFWTFRIHKLFVYLPKIEGSKNNDFASPDPLVLCLFLTSNPTVSNHRTITRRN
jgi:hypothetical protein